jgi:HAD superfamily hydrolase (TIGR01509 family)
VLKKAPNEYIIGSARKVQTTIISHITRRKETEKLMKANKSKTYNFPYPFKAVIFDMDGVLVDSESKYPAAIDRMLEENNFKLTPEQRLSFIGTSSNIIGGWLKEWFPEDERTVDELRDLYTETIYNSLRDDVDGLIEGVEDWILRLRSRDIKTAVASSSSEKSVRYAVKEFGLDKHMDVVLSAKDIKVAKPDPEIFLKAAELMGVEPSECLVIEDSQHGIDAAKAAQMACASFSGAPRLVSEVKGADIDIQRYDTETFNRIFCQI